MFVDCDLHNPLASDLFDLHNLFSSTSPFNDHVIVPVWPFRFVRNMVCKDGQLHINMSNHRLKVICNIEYMAVVVFCYKVTEDRGHVL